MILLMGIMAYSACGPFTKNKERVKRFKEAGDAIYIYIYIYIVFNMIWLIEILKI